MTKGKLFAAAGRGARECLEPSSMICEPVEMDITPSEIVNLRRTLGLSQSGLAMRLGVSVKTVQSWEQDARKPSSPARTLLKCLWQTNHAAC